MSLFNKEIVDKKGNRSEREIPFVRQRRNEVSDSFITPTVDPTLPVILFPLTVQRFSPKPHPVYTFPSVLFPLLFLDYLGYRIQLASLLFLVRRTDFYMVLVLVFSCYYTYLKTSLRKIVFSPQFREKCRCIL